MERFETKYDLLNRVYEDKRLKRTSKALMQYLVAKSDQLSCHPSVATIAAGIHMSERTVQRHMRQLEQYGYLIRKSRFYRQEQLTNQYDFVLEVMDDSKQWIHIGTGLKDQCDHQWPEEHDFIKKKYIRQVYRSSLSAKECLVLVYLVHKANTSGIAYGSLQAISRELHMSQRLLWRILLELRAKGCILIKNRRKAVMVKLVPFADRKESQEEMVCDPQMDRQEIEAAGIYPESKKVCYENSVDDRHETDDQQEQRKWNWKQIIQIAGRILRNILLHFLS